MKKPINEETKRSFFTFISLCFALVVLTSDYICALFTVLMPFLYKRKVGNVLGAVNRSSQLTMSFSAFIIFQFIHILRSQFKVSSLGFAVLWFVMFMGFIFVSQVSDTREKINKILFISTVAGGISGGIGAMQMVLYHYGDKIHESLRFMFNPFWHFFHEGALKFMALVFPDNLAHEFGIDFDTARVSTFYTRASSTFSNPIFFAMFMVTVLPIAMHCFFQMKEDKKKRVISGISIVLIAAGLAFSYTRAAYIAAAVAIGITLFCEKKQTIKTICIMPLFLIIMPSGAYKRLFTLITGNEDLSLSTHAEIYKAAFETLKEHWLLGLGTGHAPFEEILHNEYGIKQPHAHNIVLEFLLEGGIIGAGLFFLSIVLMVASLIKLAIKVKESRTLAVTLLASLGGMMCCGMFDFIFYGPKPVQIFFMLAGLIEATRRLYERRLEGDKIFEYNPNSI